MILWYCGHPVHDKLPEDGSRTHLTILLSGGLAGVHISGRSVANSRKTARQQDCQTSPGGILRDALPRQDRETAGLLDKSCGQFPGVCQVPQDGNTARSGEKCSSYPAEGARSGKMARTLVQ